MSDRKRQAMPGINHKDFRCFNEMLHQLTNIGNLKEHVYCVSLNEMRLTRRASARVRSFAHMILCQRQTTRMHNM